MLIIIYSVVLIGLMLWCSFFAGSETAITRLSLQNIHALSQEKQVLVKPLKFWQKNPSQILTFLLIGNNGGSIAIGVIAASLSVQVHELFLQDKQVFLIIIPVFVMLATLFIGEIVPKIYGQQHAEVFSRKVLGIVYIGTIICKPIISLLILISERVILLFGGEITHNSPFITSAELRRIFSSEQEAADTSGEAAPDASADVKIEVPQDTRRMLEKLTHFSRIRVEEIMVPRTQMFALDIALGREKIMHEILDQRYSRVPIYQGNLDTIVGVIYSKDIIASMQNKELIILQDLLRPAYYIPEVAKITDVMREFKTGRHHMAIVVDPYGGTAGLVTIEDILEEIVGEIYDEFDEHESTMARLNDGSFLIWAGEDIDRINDELNLRLPEDQYETLAALALDLFGKIPRAGESKNYNEYCMEIVEADRKKIYKIKLSRLKK